MLDITDPAKFKTYLTANGDVKPSVTGTISYPFQSDAVSANDVIKKVISLMVYYIGSIYMPSMIVIHECYTSAFPDL